LIDSWTMTLPTGRPRSFGNRTVWQKRIW
jgi:hypothetical protein